MFLEMQIYHVLFSFGILCGTIIFFDGEKMAEYAERAVKF